MRDAHAICLVCRVRQSVQAAVRVGALGSNSIGSSSSGSGSGSNSWTPTQGRWHTTSAAGATGASATGRMGTPASGSGTHAEGGASTRPDGGVNVSRVQVGGPRRRVPTPSAAMGTSRTNQDRRIRPRPAGDAALAIFQDIVGGQGPIQKDGRRKAAAAADIEGDNDFDLSSVSGDQLREQQKQQQQQHSGASGRHVPASMELYSHLIKLTQMRSQPETTAAQLFAFFETDMYPHMTGVSRDLPNIFRQAAQQLVREVSAVKQRNYHAPGLPTVARITQIRRQLGLLNMPESWVPLVLALVEAVALGETKGSSAAATAEDQTTSAGDSHTASTEPAASREALLADLAETWRMFSLPDMVVADPAALAQSPPTEFRMPTPDPVQLSRYARRRNLQLGLACLFPRYAPQQLRPVVPALLASYAVLTDPALSPPAVRDQAREFLSAVADVLSAIFISRHAVADMFRSAPSIGAYVLQRWPLVEATAASSKGALPPVGRARGRGRTPSSFDAIHKQVSQALRDRNLGACEAAWDRFWSAVSAPDADGAELLRSSAEMFDYFIMAFTTMRMPGRAIAVWNLMTMAGVQPTLRTWTSFMEGCKLASNPGGIQAIWDKLMASGIPVDTAVWTARISGLTQAAGTEAGMQALEEMQRVWEASQASQASQAATEKAAPAAVKPTIEPVNAAISGVLRRGDLAAAKQVLAWAGRHGIEPDLVTFNTILRHLVREGHGDETEGLLEMMRRRGIEPDEATVTILLDGTFGGGAMADRSAAEQAEAVRQVLAAVEAAGLDANQQTYAKMIYLLLQKDNDGRPVNPGAGAAVHVVLSRIRQRGLPLSSYICTILAEHYFALDPPDLDAVRSLIENGQPPAVKGVLGSGSAPESVTSAASSTTTTTTTTTPPPPPPAFPRPSFDRVFWERVVRGFAQVGDTASAQKYFVNIADSLALTNSTLEDLLRALIRNGEWEAARQLVGKVQAQKTFVVQGGEETAGRPTDARLFRHRFWHLANEHGLLRE